MDNICGWPLLPNGHLGEGGRDIVAQQSSQEQGGEAEKQHNEVRELEISEWARRASEMGMHPLMITTLQSLESVKREDYLYFPRVIAAQPQYRIRRTKCVKRV